MSARDLPIPEPLYSCNGCDTEYSWPAEDLAWYEGNEEYEEGWYCNNCSDHYFDECQDPVIGLKEELDRRGLSR